MQAHVNHVYWTIILFSLLYYGMINLYSQNISPKHDVQH